MDKKLEERKKELESRFIEVQDLLKKASQEVSGYQTEMISLKGAYIEVCNLMDSEPKPLEEEKK
jgi:hypothetical protein